MPLYDFECQSCSAIFEELTSTTNNRVVCMLCGSSKVSQLISPLADYTGHTSMTVQYAARRAPDNLRDSFITKTPRDPTFLSKQVQK